MTNALKAPVAGADPLATDVAQLANLFNALLDAGVLQLAGPQSTPAALTAVASGTSGNLNGAYRWITVLITGWKQGDGSYYVSGFAPSTDSAQVTITSNSASLSNIATGTATVIGRAVYRTAAGGAAGSEKFAFVIWDNGTTTYTDNVADASLGTGMPTSSSSPAAYGTAIPANVPTSNTTGTSLSGYVDTSTAQTIGGAKTFTSPVTINRSDPGLIFEAQDSGHTNEQIKLTNYSGELQVQDIGTNGTWVKNLLRINRSTGAIYTYGGNTLDNGSGGATFAGAITAGHIQGNGSQDVLIDGVGHDVQIASTSGSVGITNSDHTAWKFQYNTVGDSFTFTSPVTFSGSTLTYGGSSFIYGGNTMPQLRYTNGYVEWNNGGTWQGVGGVKNVQRGSVSLNMNSSNSLTTVNVTITSVNMAKAFVTFNNVYDTSNTSGYQNFISAYLTSSTNLAITYQAGGFANTLSFNWEVVESY